MFFNQPDGAGEGNNRAVSALAFNRVFGVLVACGLTASCSSSSDFVTQLGFGQMAAQGVQVDSGSKPASSEKAVDSKTVETLAFATPTLRPAAPAEEMAALAGSESKQPIAAGSSTSASEKDEPETANAVTDKTDAVAKQADSASVENADGKKRGFFSRLFGGGQEQVEPESKPVETAAIVAPPVTAPEPVPPSAKLSQMQKPTIKIASASAYSASVLPGVRGNHELFEISRKSSGGDDSDIDLYEEVGSYQVASAGGLARLAPHGLLRQRDDVDTSCFKPKLVQILKTIERHYGKKILVTSGYRSPAHNRRVRGARKSAHMSCSAADIQVAGVSRWELANFARSIPGRGGVGTYCHTASVHVDVGAERDWNWRCRK